MPRNYHLTVLLCLSLSLVSCAPLYIPLLPDRQDIGVSPRLDLSDSEGLLVSEGQLVLRVNIKEVPEADWLAVQWFSPANKEVASDSLWIRPQDVGFSKRFVLPSRVPVSTGEWRAVLSYKNQLARQFSLLIEN